MQSLIFSSAALDTNLTGTSDQLKAALKQDVEGNMAFMGPVLYGSVGTLVEDKKLRMKQASTAYYSAGLILDGLGDLAKNALI